MTWATWQQPNSVMLIGCSCAAGVISFSLSLTLFLHNYGNRAMHVQFVAVAAVVSWVSLHCKIVMFQLWRALNGGLAWAVTPGRLILCFAYKKFFWVSVNFHSCQVIFYSDSTECAPSATFESSCQCNIVDELHFWSSVDCWFDIGLPFAMDFATTF